MLAQVCFLQHLHDILYELRHSSRGGFHQWMQIRLGFASIFSHGKLLSSGCIIRDISWLPTYRYLNSSIQGWSPQDHVHSKLWKHVSEIFWKGWTSTAPRLRSCVQSASVGPRSAAQPRARPGPPQREPPAASVPPSPGVHLYPGRNRADYIK